MITVKRFISDSTALLSRLYDTTEARCITTLLLETYLGLSSAELLVYDKDTVLSSDKADKLSRARERLLEGEPLQYILGLAHFFDLKLYVAPGVLIPRPETEELVYLIKQDLMSEALRGLRVLDIGTGSACIPCGLATQMPEGYIESIEAIDLSPEALRIAAVNVRQIEERYPKPPIQLYEQDLFADWSDNPTLGGYDLIVSNPPYIHPQEAEQMTSQVLDWEPSCALFTPADEPTRYYDRIAELATSRQMLRPQGRLYLELNPLYAELTLGRMTAILQEYRSIQTAELLHDLSQKQRFARIVLKD